MAKCPYCKHVLEDSWLKKMGASLMGKTGGASKARSLEATRAAANKRWQKEGEITPKDFVRPLGKKKKA
jgi:hypothetical protein